MDCILKMKRKFISLVFYNPHTHLRRGEFVKLIAQLRSAQGSPKAKEAILYVSSFKYTVFVESFDQEQVFSSKNLTILHILG